MSGALSRRLICGGTTWDGGVDLERPSAVCYWNASDTPSRSWDISATDTQSKMRPTDAPNQSLETNRRPALALGGRWQPGRAVHDPAWLSGGGRSACR